MVMSYFVACETVTYVATLSQLGGDTRDTRIYFLNNFFFSQLMYIYIYIFFHSQGDILYSVIQFIINV